MVFPREDIHCNLFAWFRHTAKRKRIKVTSIQRNIKTEACVQPFSRGSKRMCPGLITIGTTSSSKLFFWFDCSDALPFWVASPCFLLSVFVSFPDHCFQYSYISEIASEKEFMFWATKRIWIFNHSPVPLVGHHLLLHQVWLVSVSSCCTSSLQL